MANLNIFGTEFANVSGFKLPDTNGDIVTYSESGGDSAVLGTKSITSNGTYNASSDNLDGYSSVTVNVAGSSPNLQSKTKSITPTESAQSETVTADSGYDGLSQVNVSVGAISKTYVGSEVARNNSSDLTVSGATVNVPSGFYESAASKSVASGSASTPNTTITANPSISVSSSGLITANASASQNVTPNVSAGYVSQGTAGTVNVSGSKTQQLDTQGATTYNTSTSDQTIASGKYLTGAQTIKAVTVSGLDASKIASGTTVMVGDENDPDRIANVSGTLTFVTYIVGTEEPSASLGNVGDIYLKVVE